MNRKGLPSAHGPVDSPGRVTLWGIEAFLAAAEEGSVQGAARQLQASVSAISQQVSTLEAALGAALFDRSLRPMRLTPAGATFRRHAQAIVNELAAARAAIGLSGLSGLSHFRLGFIEDFESEVTPRLLADLGAQYPGCRFALQTGASHQLAESLEARQLDLVVAADIGAASETVEIHPILEEPFVAIVPKGTRLHPEDPDLPLILYTQRHMMGRQIADALSRQNLRVANRFELDSYNSIMAMVAEGAGWSILTPLAVLHAERFQGKVDILPLPFATFTRRIAVMARRDLLGEMPAEIAGRLRTLMQDRIVGPVLADHPWMASGLRIIS